MVLEINCNSVTLNNSLYVVKSIMNIIMIIAPILAIISFTYLLIKITMNPEEKKLIKKLKNSSIALVIVFFIPILVNIVMSIMGESTNFSSCYNNAKKTSSSTTYEDPDKRDKVNPRTGSDEYESGESKQLAFHCKSEVIHSQFSCDTLHRVAAHYRDFNYYNFAEVINSYGGFQGYVDEVGGIFKQYYGKKVQVETVYEFQKIAEYVFGFLYMYGADYFNGKDYDDTSKKYCKWGGFCMFYHDEKEAKLNNQEFVLSTGSEDAFYPGQLRYDDHGMSNSHNFDAMISDTSAPNITSGCNWTVDMIFYKAGIFGTGRTKVNASASAKALAKAKGNKVISDFKDLKVGDILEFFKTEVDSSNPDTWSKWGHVAVVGEVDKKKELLLHMMVEVIS